MDLDTLHAKFWGLANAIPAEHYGWRPMAGVRSVGEVLKHIASHYYMYAPLSFTGQHWSGIERKASAVSQFESTATSKAEVLPHLRAGHAYARSTIRKHTVAHNLSARPAGGPDQPLVRVAISSVADMHEHLGQLIAYARSLGIVPPWSR